MTSSHQRPGISIPFLLEIGITFALILALGVPRLLALNRFVTIDERLWLDRSGKFYYALAHGDFAATFQKSHPGVTVMWAGLTGYLAAYPQYYEDHEGLNRPIGLSTLLKRDYQLPLRILAAGRRTMVILNMLALGLSFLFACRLFGLLSSFIGFLLIAFDPFHIALSKLLHLDGLLANLALLSLLAFLVYLNEHNRSALVVSAVAAGMAWLTKSPGLFLIPMMGLLILLGRLRRRGDWLQADWRKFILNDLCVLAAWGGIAMLVFFLLWPAMWVDPLGSVLRVLTETVGYAQGGHESSVFFNGTIHPNGEIPDNSFYLISFLWRATPITLLGLLAVPLLFLRGSPVFRSDEFQYKTRNSLSHSPTGKQNLLHDIHQRWALIALLLFALCFSVFMNLGLKKFDRYILPSMVPLELMAGIGLVWIAGWVGQFLGGMWKGFFIGAILLSLVAVQATLAWRAFPYFFNYYNPLLGGTRKAVKVMQIGWGEGLDQAAQYINNQPNAEQLRVMAWYAGGPFSYFSRSRVTPLDVDHPWSTADWNEFERSDYVVVYIHEWQRNLPAEVLDQLRGATPEHSVWIDGLEYVQVYKIP